MLEVGNGPGILLERAVAFFKLKDGEKPSPLYFSLVSDHTSGSASPGWVKLADVNSDETRQKFSVVDKEILKYLSKSPAQKFPAKFIAATIDGNISTGV